MLSILLLFLAGLAALLVVLRHSRRASSSSFKSVALVVLGDIGRSPRMLYHAQSFAANGYRTQIVAYRGSAPPKQLAENPLVSFVYLPTSLGFISGLPRPLFLLLAPFKVVLGAFGLLKALVWTLETPPALLFLQNPPAIPTLPGVKLASFLTGSKVIIDWHNTGYSVLALRLGEQHPVVRVARFIEHLFGRSAYAHLCVSDAMKAQLQREAKLSGQVVTFHDRPPSHFRRLSDKEQHELFSRLSVFSTLSFPSSPSSSTSPLSNSANTTRFSHPLSPTHFTSPSGSPLPSRPALLVSATSWTADEDFSLLLRALKLYEKAARAFAEGKRGWKGESERRRGRLPRVVVVITGKGAGKEQFEKEVEGLEKGWEWVRVRTAWLAIEDYPKLLGSADLGISLHTSTSGIDLPMKVVDMFGCGLPALALDFPCLDELVKHNQNGRVFQDVEGLADQLIDLLLDFPRPFPSSLDRLRDGIRSASYGGEGEGEKSARWGSWKKNWVEVVLPLLQHVGGQAGGQ
ncbi:hypothetical protein JCM8547_008441 [Rhodosporidiobolus lusitaniae]